MTADCFITLRDGTVKDVDYDDIVALLEAGILRATELDETGRAKSFVITELGYEYYDQELKDKNE